LSRPDPALIVTPVGGLTTTEAGGVVSFTLELNDQPGANVSVIIENGNSDEGVLSSTAITFTSGDWNVPQTITVTGQDDDVVDGNQTYDITFGVTSSDIQFNAISTNTSPLTLTNTDDDTAGVTVTPASLVTEYNVSDTFTVKLTSQPSVNVTVVLSSSDTAQGTVSPSSMTFSAGNWNVVQTATVTGANPTPGDNTYAIDLDVTSADTDYDGLVLFLPAVNSYSTVSIVATDASAAEPANSGTFTVSRDGNTTFDLLVNYTVSNASTATSGADYVALSGSLTILAGQASATIAVTPLNDSLDESDETVVVAISAGDGYAADAATATITIADDDAPPGASFSANQSVAEGSMVIVTVTLSDAALSYPVQVPYSVSGTATNPGDHNAQNGVITINSGTTGSLSFTTVNDSLNEGNETVVFTMGSPTNATVGTRDVTTVTIIDDDTNTDNTPPAASFSANQTVTEGSTVTVTVTLSGLALSYPVQVPYSVSGTATNPNDHSAQDGTVTITSGTTGSLSFTTASDSLSEGNETVIITMGSPTNATPGATTVTTVTIIDGNNGGTGGDGDETGADSGGGALNLGLLFALFVLRVLVGDTHRYRSPATMRVKLMPN
jgi:hypothetical protein